MYNWDSCDLLVASSGEEIYRLNLDTGQFKEPFCMSFEGCRKMGFNPAYQLLACGGVTGVCEFWDPRARKSISTLNVGNIDGKISEISAIKFDTDSLTLGVGTSSGNCLFYDIRSSRPVFTKEHQYGLPIVDITFHNSSRKILTTDKKLVKIWERDGPNQGKVLTNIETPADINSLLMVEDRRGPTGLIMMAGEQQRVMTYFVPQLGPYTPFTPYTPIHAL